MTEIDRRKNILWGITGSVAAIRSDMLAGPLMELGNVQIVTTRRGKHFLPLIPSSILRHDDDEEWSNWQSLGDPVLHIELRRWADVFLIAPASADCLAKLSNGICDSLLLCVARAWDFSKPLLVAPAMNTLMWEHPTTAEHLARIRSWGGSVIDPVAKQLACADVGMGAIASPASIASAVAASIFHGPSV